MPPPLFFFSDPENFARRARRRNAPPPLRRCVLSAPCFSIPEGSHFRKPRLSKIPLVRRHRGKGRACPPFPQVPAAPREAPPLLQPQSRQARLRRRVPRCAAQWPACPA